MYRILIISLFLVFANALNAQEKYNYISADSVTYQYFMNGNWDKLIKCTEAILKQDVDFKTLRQRLGYAYFVKTDYVKASIQYKHAYELDKTDLVTISYLYYSYLNSGNQILANYYAQKLPAETLDELHLKSFRLFDALDFEYNYKTAYTDIRSAPNYLRIGLNSQLSYNLKYYQSISNYKQVFYSIYNTTQNEYFGLLNFTATDKLSLLAGYHYINTKLDSSANTSHVFLGKALYRLNRFDFGLSYSIYNTDLGNTNQVGLQVGVLLLGKHNIYLSSTLYHLSDSVSSGWVFNQTAGLLLTKKLWAEGSVSLGTLNNFVDLNGLYIYNSLDPTTFRTGLSLYYYVNKRLTLYSNYTFSKKHITEYDVNYNQNSITGGIIWKF